MKQQEIKSVPNQKIIEIKKLKCDKNDKSKIYTVNRIEGINQAAQKLQSKCGFKLYIYMAKNQDNYKFALSSADFTQWSGCALTAYNTAIKELIETGYLIQQNDNTFIFVDYIEE